MYLVHGGPKYQVQARYSVLTLLALLAEDPRPDWRIVIYTDRPEGCPEHPQIQAERLDADELRRFRGPLDYVHRIKMEVLRRAALTLDGPLLYVDCDTRWTALPDAPFRALSMAPAEGQPRAAFMHVFEGQVNASFYGDYAQVLARHSELRARLGIHPGAEWPMWNAGTVGVPAGSAGIFEHALAVTDGLIFAIRRRNWVEQLALSIAIGQRLRIEAFDAYLEHYWQHSAELPALLGRFFASLPAGSIEHQARRAAGFAIDAEALEAIRRSPGHRLAQVYARSAKSMAKRRIALKALLLGIIGIDSTLH